MGMVHFNELDLLKTMFLGSSGSSSFLQLLLRHAGKPTSKTFIVMSEISRKKEKHPQVKQEKKKTAANSTERQHYSQSIQSCEYACTFGNLRTLSRPLFSDIPPNYPLTARCLSFPSHSCCVHTSGASTASVIANI